MRIFTKSKIDSKQEVKGVKVEIPSTLKPQLAALLKRLRENDPSLTRLDLRQQGLSLNDVKIFSAILAHNTTLLSLHLGSNSLDKQSAQALAAALEHNKTLLLLDLSHNAINLKGAESIINALKKNNTLTNLNIEHNLAEAEIGKAIGCTIEMLKHNKTLIEFKLFRYTDTRITATIPPIKSEPVRKANKNIENIMKDNNSLCLLQPAADESITMKVRENQKLYDQFFEAYKYANHEEITKLLKLGAGIFTNRINLTIRQINLTKRQIESTPLIHVVLLGSLECVRLLLPYCRNFYFSHDGVETALHIAEEKAKKCGVLSVFVSILQLLKIYQQIITTNPESIGNAEFISKALASHPEASKLFMAAKSSTDVTGTESKDKKDEKLLERAQQGDPEAQYRVGLSSQSLEVGKVWFQKAADQGHKTAMDKLVPYLDPYHRGDQLKINELRDNELMVMELAQRGSPQALYVLAEYYEKLRYDASTTLNYYKQAAILGNGQAWVHLASAYERGNANLGIKQDHLLAEAWCRKGALAGIVSMQLQLANLYASGKDSYGIKQDPMAAFEWYQKAAEASLLSSDKSEQFNVLFAFARCYENGLGTKQDYSKAFEWHHRNYQLTSSYHAAKKLGEFYEKGLGVKQDGALAFQFYEKATSASYGFCADDDLARCYEMGIGVKQDYVQAVSMYEFAASRSNAAAKERLELIYRRPDIMAIVNQAKYKKEQAALQVKLDMAQMLIRQAEAGDGQTQYELALSFEKGKGIPQDYKQAFEWFIKAANQGHIVSQLKTAAYYENGWGGKKDYAQAYFWYQKAADQGNDDACAGLKSLKEKGYTPASSVEFKSALSPSSPKDTKTGAKEDKSLDGSCEIAYDQLTFGKELGRGGFGVVYQGTWRFNNVAIKQLLTKSLSAEALEEFNSESRIMAQLRSDHIVQFRGICVSPTYCLVMEYMPKGSLFNLLRSSGPIDWSVRYRMITEIASGLAFLHASNIFHRDLKSLNVLLDEHYRTKLCDFGLSKVKKENQSTATVGGPVGTIPWMAPELFARRPAFTAKSDIYSLAMTLWEIASRKTPFADADNPGLISAWVTQGQREEIPSDTPLKISSLIRFCWHADPDKRPTAAEVVTYLRSDQTEFKGSCAASSSGALSSQAASIQANFASVSGSDLTGSTIFQGNLISRHMS